MSLPRLSFVVALCLCAGPGLADNVWSRTVTPTGDVTYAPAAFTPAPAPQQATPAPTVLAAAPDFNRWSGGPGTGAGGFPSFCGQFGFGGGPGFGFSFGF